LCGYVWLYIKVYADHGENCQGRVDCGPVLGPDREIWVSTGASELVNLV